MSMKVYFNYDDDNNYHHRVRDFSENIGHL